MREVWIREYCDVAGGGHGCIVGDLHEGTTHLRKVSDDEVREALRSFLEEDVDVWLGDPLSPFLKALP